MSSKIKKKGMKRRAVTRVYNKEHYIHNTNTFNTLVSLKAYAWYTTTLIDNSLNLNFKEFSSKKS